MPNPIVKKAIKTAVKTAKKKPKIETGLFRSGMSGGPRHIWDTGISRERPFKVGNIIDAGLKTAAVAGTGYAAAKGAKAAVNAITNSKKSESATTKKPVTAVKKMGGTTKSKKSNKSKN